MSTSETQPVIIIIGPTASGKTRLAVQLAKTINGEIVSADSRQVFRGMDIGSGKDLNEYGDIPHHLIDIRNPGEPFSVSDFQQETWRALSDISTRQKTPIICGGTMYYVKALIEDYPFDQPGTDIQYTEKLEALNRPTLYRMLKEKGLWNTRRWDQDSRRRIARAIEKMSSAQALSKEDLPAFSDRFNYRCFYTNVNRSTLRENIRNRLRERLAEGLIKEVADLLESGISVDQLKRYGLEYRWVTQYVEGEIGLEETVNGLSTDISRFAKRQMTFIRYLMKQGHQLHPISSHTELLNHLSDWFPTAE